MPALRSVVKRRRPACARCGRPAPRGPARRSGCRPSAARRSSSRPCRRRSTFMPEVGEAGPRHEPDVARPDHADVHSRLPDARRRRRRQLLRLPPMPRDGPPQAFGQRDAGAETEQALGLFDRRHRSPGRPPAGRAAGPARAVLPVASSIPRTSSARVTGCAPPRLTISKSGGAVRAASTPSTMSST